MPIKKYGGLFNDYCCLEKTKPPSPLPHHILLGGGGYKRRLYGMHALR